jgi:D-alanyl-D-alanine carboxypeptidase
MTVLQESRARQRAAQRRARQRRRRLIFFTLLGVVLAVTALFVLEAGRTARSTAPRLAAPAAHRRPKPRHVAPTYGIAMAPASEQVRMRQTFHLTSGILFDVWTGRIMWAHNPGVRLPIASLTKMMTALVVLRHSSTSDQVLITKQAVHFSGSGVGLLPLGKHVGLVPLLYGLLLPSGNDAAIALAQHVAGDERQFVTLMNAQAHTMGLTCSHFATASGIVDQDNYSCTTDLSVLAHALLDQPLLAHIVGARSAVIRFPIKGGKLFLYNNNPLLITQYPGADGVKTGYTTAAGACLVATARRGNAWLGVVLLHSIDPAGQAAKLLNAGFAKLRIR